MDALISGVHYLHYHKHFADGYFLLLKHNNQVNFVKIYIFTSSKITCLSKAFHMYVSSHNYQLRFMYEE